MIQEDSFAADAEPPMDILPNHEDIDCVLPNQVIILTLAAVKISPVVHGLTLSEHLARHYAKSMVNTMDRNTKDSTSGKGGTIYEVSSYSSASDTCSIQHTAQVNAYSGATVVYQPNNGLVNNDLEVVEIVDTYCHVKVARADGQRLCLSVTTGAHVRLILSLSLPISMISLTKAAPTIRSVDIKHLIIVSMIEARFPAWSVKV
jgi:hypothetical protein